MDKTIHNQILNGNAMTQHDEVHLTANIASIVMMSAISKHDDCIAVSKVCRTSDYNNDYTSKWKIKQRQQNIIESRDSA